MKRRIILDAAESRFYLRQLENIEATVHKIDYPELKGSRLCPTDTGYDPGAVSLIYRQLDKVGKAKVISDRSKRLPRVDVFGREFAQGVKPLGASFAHSIMEIKGAAKAGVALDAERAAAAHETIHRLLEDICAVGDSESGLAGMLNHADVSSDTVPNGVAGTAAWSTKTADEMLADLNLGVQKVRDATTGVEAPDTCLVPEEQYTLIAQTPIGAERNLTVLQRFLASSPWVRNVEPWHYLNGRGSGATDRMMFYRRDPSKLKMRNPHGYEQLPAEREGLEYITDCFMTTSGVVFYKPKSAYYLDGI